MFPGRAVPSKPTGVAPRAALAALLLVSLAGLAPTVWAEDDPPARVARLSLVDGNVSMAPSGDDQQWSAAALNRPMSNGDRLSTDEGARAELQVGSATLQVDHGSALDIAALDDRNAQFELSSGSANLYISALTGGENYEIDTPTIAFVATAPGDYRVDVGADGEGTTVKVLAGAGTVYGQNSVSYPVSPLQSYQFPNQQLTDVAARPVYGTDEFDDFAAERNRRIANPVAQQYLSPDVIGSADLADNGQWADEPGYGPVWYPGDVDADWAPYREGHWVWIDPWGWTWVDDAPWGFAPFHYGRWAYINQRWGWMPGPRYVRPMYSPALVAFVGGGGAALGYGGGPVGWFPLGPRDVYCPPYRVSHQYFFSLNVSNVNDGFVDRGRINRYYDEAQVGGGDGRDGFHPDFAYRNAPNAITVVSHDTFAGARPVGRGPMRFDPQAFANAPVSYRPPVAPIPQSLVQHTGGVPRPPMASFNRPLVSHRPLPQAPAAFATRQPFMGQSPIPAQTQAGMRPAPSAPRNPAEGFAPATPSPFDSEANRNFPRSESPSTGFSPRGGLNRSDAVAPTFTPRAEVGSHPPVPQYPAQPAYTPRPQYAAPVAPQRPEYPSRPSEPPRPEYLPRPEVPARPAAPAVVMPREAPRPQAPAPRPAPPPARGPNRPGPNEERR